MYKYMNFTAQNIYFFFLNVNRETVQEKTREKEKERKETEIRRKIG